MTAGRVALVTGATAGIGLETALGLAHAGFHVIIAGRNETRLAEARRTLAERGAGAVETACADFSSLAEVRQLAKTVLEQRDRLDVLVNNAGQITPEYQTSADGCELTFAVNHLAPFLLTTLLLDRLRTSASARNVPARIINVASQAHKGARLDIGALTGDRDWTPLKAYGRSKLCNILFTRALARRLDSSEIVAASLHPGVIATKIGDRAGNIAGWGWRLIKPFLTTPEKGAATTLFLATTADATPYHGAYLIGGKPAQPDPAALDNALAEQLWSESARLVGLSIG